ncbi:MAG: TolC family protein [Bacteroidales bacterium]|nr:TolC family protein [Bacteroidales bacterium]
MMKFTFISVIAAGMLMFPICADAQYKDKKAQEETPKTEAQLIMEQADSSEIPVVITLDQALKIALSENVSVKVADLEIKRSEYAKKGAYAALYPQIDLTGSYQRTLKKQVMYMTMNGQSMGIEVGKSNTINAGASAAMPIVNAQLWKSLKLSALDVELSVEKARSSRLDMVTQVKNAYFGALFAKEAFNVYKEVYENAVTNLEEAQKKYDSQKVSEFELVRAKTSVANAIPNVYNAESSIILALWQLKAVLGVDLDMNIDVAGNLDEYSQQMFYDIHQHDSVSLDNNTTMKQLAIQVEQLAQNIKVQQFANIPSLALAFNFSYMSMADDVSFKEFPWTPYSTVGLSLNIPIFAGGKRHQAIRQAKNQYQQVQLQVENTERQLKIAIRQSLNTMEMNMKSYYAAQSAVESAQKAYDIAEASYKLGRGTLLDLNDAQLALTQSQLAKSQAVYNFITAKAQLEQTLGNDFVE